MTTTNTPQCINDCHRPVVVLMVVPHYQEPDQRQFLCVEHERYYRTIAGPHVTFEDKE